MVELALIPANQLNLWTNYKLVNTHDLTQDTHHGIVAESTVSIYHQIAQTETKFTMTCNQSDAPRKSLTMYKRRSGTYQNTQKWR